MAAKLTKVPGERLLYLRDGTYYMRVKQGDVDTNISLKTTRIGVARTARDEWEHSERNKKLGITPPPPKEEEKAPELTVLQVLDDYVADDHSTVRRGQIKHPGVRHRRSEDDAIVQLRKFFAEDLVNNLNNNRLDEYHTWRPKQAIRNKGKTPAKGSCDRITDLELNTLFNALNWSVRKNKLDANPIAKRTRYHSYVAARHAKTVAPLSPEELMAVALVLLSSRKSETLGWQFLWEALTGMRVDEALKLEFRPIQGDTPGHVAGNFMFVRPSLKNSQGQSQMFLHDATQEFLKAHEIWHKLRYPESKWMFPSLRHHGKRAVYNQSLTSRLETLFRSGKLKRKVTSQGCRAYYVLIRRSWGITDSQIAVEMNQVGGLETLRTSYGMVPLSWLEGKGPKYPWFPKEGPAWTKLIDALTAAVKKNKGKLIAAGDVLPDATVIPETHQDQPDNTSGPQVP